MRPWRGRGEREEVVDKVRKVDNEPGDNCWQAATRCGGGAEGHAHLGLLHSFGRSTLSLRAICLLEMIMVWWRKGMTVPKRGQEQHTLNVKASVLNEMRMEGRTLLLP